MKNKRMHNFYQKLVTSRSVRRFLLWQRSVPLKKKLPILTLVEIIIPMILVCIMIYCSQIVIRNQAIDYTEDSLNLMKTDIDRLMQRAEAVSQSIVYDEQLYGIMAEKNGEPQMKYYETYDRLNNLLKKYILLNNEIEVVYVMSDSKEFYVCDNGNRRYLSPSLYDDLYAAAQREQGKNIWYLADDENQLQNILFPGLFMIRIP